MTDEASSAAGAALPPARVRVTDALLDGAIAGFVGVLAIIAWSLALDLGAHRSLPTFAWVPAHVLERLAGTTGDPAPTPLDVVTGVLFLLLGGAVLGSGVSWVLTLARQTPTAAITLTVSLSVLLLTFFAIDAISGAGLFSRLRPWAVIGGHTVAASAMTLTLWKRQPRLIEGRRELWDDEP